MSKYTSAFTVNDPNRVSNKYFINFIRHEDNISYHNVFPKLTGNLISQPVYIGQLEGLSINTIYIDTSMSSFNEDTGLYESIIPFNDLEKIMDIQCTNNDGLIISDFEFIEDGTLKILSISDLDNTKLVMLLNNSVIEVPSEDNEEEIN